MVLTPTLLEPDPTSAPIRSRTARKLDAQKRKGGLWHRIVRLRAARKLSRLATVRGAGSTMARAVGMGRAFGAPAMVSRAAKAAANPVVLGIAALAMTAVVVGRLASGKPFEGMGSELNNLLLGDMDDAARAKMSVRSQFESDPDLMRFIESQGGVTSQIRKVMADLSDIETKRQKGKSMIEQAFPVNGMLDFLILRIKEALTGSWSKHAVPQAIEDFSAKLDTHLVELSMAMPDHRVPKQTRKWR